MVTWGIGIAFVLLTVVVLGYLVVRLHLVRRRATSGLHSAQLALQQQSAAFDNLLMAANNFSDRLLQLVWADLGMRTDSPSGRSGPSSAPLTQPFGAEEEGEFGPSHSSTSGLPISPSVVERYLTPSERHFFRVAMRSTSPMANVIRRQRERQWEQVNVASEAAEHAVPEPAGTGVFDVVSGEMLEGFHGSAMPAVSRERSRRKESPEESERQYIHGISERSARAGAIAEKSGGSGIIDPRALWERETASGAYG
jgi:hypothetical protein